MAASLLENEKSMADFAKYGYTDSKPGGEAPSDINPEFERSVEGLIQTAPLGAATGHIWRARASAPIDSVDQLKGMRVGHRLGMSFGTTIDRDARFDLEPAPLHEMNVRKLELGRIDAFLGWLPDLYAVFDDLGMEPLPHSPPIVTFSDRIVCRDTERNRAFIAVFDAALLDLERSGRLERLQAD